MIFQYAQDSSRDASDEHVAAGRLYEEEESGMEAAALENGAMNGGKDGVLCIQDFKLASSEIVATNEGGKMIAL